MLATINFGILRLPTSYVTIWIFKCCVQCYKYTCFFNGCKPWSLTQRKTIDGFGKKVPRILFGTKILETTGGWTVPNYEERRQLLLVLLIQR
jgi:hypothetical protein